MLSKGQQDFQNRLKDDNTGTESGLDFHVWYHDDDVTRMLWALYQKYKNKQKILQPFMFTGMVQNNGWYSFQNFMDLAKEALLVSNKLYFPFIIKPDPRHAHFCAGIIVRKNIEDQKPTLFLFNPSGVNNQHLAAYKKKLGIENENDFEGMNVIFSPHVIQDVNKEGESVSSCGPLCVEFIRCVLESLEWVKNLDSNFRLPDSLMAYTQDQENEYKERILKVRKEHDMLLATINEKELKEINTFNAPNNEYYMEMPNDDEVMESEEVISPTEFDEFDNVFLPIVPRTPIAPVLQDPAPIVVAQMTLTPVVTVPVVPIPVPQPMPVIPKEQNPATPKTQPNPPAPRIPNGIEAVQKEIDRLNATLGCFSNGISKAQSIESALKAAIANPEVVDVRQDINVRKALGYHRLFSFFGCFNARALDNVDKSYELEQNIKNTK